HQLVVGRIEDVVQRHRELDHAERGAKMPAVDADRVDNELAQLGAYLHQLLGAELFKVVGRGYRREQRTGFNRHQAGVGEVGQ
nr:hypothetical protein [Tanacetum cinerariifolium]